MGLRLIGLLKIVVERVRYTVVSPDEITNLPDRSFDYIWFIGRDSLVALSGLSALIRRHTKIIALDDDILYRVLREKFPDHQIFRGWSIGTFSTPKPDIEPNLLQIDVPAPSIYLESKSDQDLLALAPLVKILRKAGLATFVTRAANNRADIHKGAVSSSIRVLTRFVNLDADKKQPTQTPRV
jgi:hypothetical protein